MVENMPLPCLTNEIRCTAHCKARKERCLNLRAYGQPVCRFHGARKPNTVLRGKDHPAYVDGSQTREAKTAQRTSSVRLRELEQMMIDSGMVSADFKRMVGRKPCGYV